MKTGIILFWLATLITMVHLRKSGKLLLTIILNVFGLEINVIAMPYFSSTRLDKMRLNYFSN